MRALFGWTVLAMSSVASAQVNVEPTSAASTDPGWAAKVSAGYGFASGNTNYTDLSLSGNLHFVSAHPQADPEEPHNAFQDRFIISASANRRTYSADSVRDGRFVHVRYTRMQWLNFGGEVFGQVGNDRLLLQKWRILGGAGIRAVLADTVHADIIVGTGYMYEWEHRNISEGFSDDPFERDHRSTSYVSLQLFPIPDHLSIQNTVYAQPRLDDFADVQILNDFKVEVKIAGILSLTTSLFLRWDSRPPSELSPLDIRMSNGLSVTI